MVRRRFVTLSILVVGFSVFGLVALFASDAQACPPPTGFRYVGGSCYRVKGIELTAEVNHAGNPKKEPKTLSADFTPIGLNQGQEPIGVLFCVNRPGHQPPGQRLVPVPPQVQMGCSAKVTNLVSPNDGGTAEVVCTSKLTRTELQFFDSFCSSGQVAIDFVPIRFLSDVRYAKDDETLIEEARHDCVLPSPETLAWDRKLGRPEPREFECSGPFDVP